MTLQIEAQKLMPAESKAAGLEGDNITVAQILRTLWRRRVVLFSAIFTIVALGFIVLKLLTPAYTSEAIIVVSARQDSVVDMEQSYMNMPPPDPVVRSEVDALQSRTLVDRVIDREHLIRDPEFNLYARPFDPNPIICFPAAILPGFLRIALGCEKRDPRLLTPAQLKYNVATQVLKAYDVTPDPKTYSVKVDFTSVNAEKASRIANAFADEYMKSQVNEHVAEAQRAAIVMSPRLVQLSKDATRADRAVEQFEESHHIIDLPEASGQNTLALQEVENLAQELSAARTTRAQLEAAQQEVQQLVKDPSQMLSAPAVAAAPAVENVRIQEVAATAQLASLQGTYGERHPLVVSAKNEVEKLRERLIEESQRAVKQLEVQMRQAQISEQQLQARMNQLTSARTSESRAMPQLRQLEAEQAATKTVYDTFVQGLFRATSQNGVPTAKGHIVQYADTVDWPTFPNIWISIAIISVAAVLAAISLVYVLEAADKSFHGADEIEDAVGLPVLGMTLLARTPWNRAAMHLAPTISRRIVTEPASSMSESVRLTRTAIAFSRTDRQTKVIMVTSAVPSEGKTTFALMLTRQSASTGSRAIVIEAEMRRPAFARELDSIPTKGLAEYLLGHATLDEVTGVDDASGAHFIAAGQSNSSSSELLASARMAALLHDLRARYDFVVVDTPPATMVADALQLGGMIDAAILVVKWAATPRHLVLDAIKKLRASKAPLAGVVLTQVDPRQYKFFGHGTLPYEYAKSYYVES